MASGAEPTVSGAQRWSQAYDRALVLVEVGYGVVAVTVLSLAPDAGTGDARSGAAAGMLAAAVYVSLAGAAFFAINRPGRPLTALVAVTLLWDAGDWAGATSTPALLQLVALAAPALLPAALLSAALRWSGRPSVRARRVLTGMYTAGVLVIAVHLIAYDPFDDPRCRITCAPASLPWSADPAATHVASLVAGIAVMVMSLVAAIMLTAGRATARRGWTGWGTVGAVRGAAALAEVGIAVAAAGTVVAWGAQANPWSGLFGARALTTLAVGAAMVASGVQALRASRDVRQLGEALGQPDQLAGSIGRALHDPQLRVAYWYPEDQRWVDAAGSPVVLHEPARSITTVARLGDVVARLVHGSRRPPQGDLSEALGPSTLLAIDNARLVAVARARSADIRASRQRIVEGGDAERRRLERDLHDGAQQRLSSVALLLGMAGSGADDPPTAARLRAAEQQARGIVAELREIAHGIFPAVLSEEGLAAALVALVEGASVAVDLEHLEDRRYDPDVEMAVYAVIDVAVAQCAEATARGSVRVAVRECGGRVQVEVTAEGVDQAEPAHDAAVQEVADRVGALGGALTVGAGPDGGTRLCALIPFQR